jgi:hypothetical protein
VEGGVRGGAGGYEKIGGSTGCFATLSTAASSELDKEAATKIGISSGVSMRGSIGLCGYVLDLAAKGTYYLNCKTGLGIHDGDHLQGKRTEDKDKGCVRVFVTCGGIT